MTDTLLRPTGDQHSPAHATAHLSWALVHALNGIAADEGATRANAFHAALGLVLRRFTGTDELLVRIGTDADAFSVRTDMDDETSFLAGIRAVRAACDRNEEFAVYDADDIEITVAGAAGYTLRGDLTGDVLELTLSQTSREAAVPPQIVLDALVAFLDGAVAAPAQPAVSLALTGAAECERLLWRADGPRRPRDIGATLDRIVAERAHHAPDAIAVVHNGISTTYGQLIARAAVIAASLRRSKIVTGDRVGVCAEPSADLFAAILGIWAAGAVYVPLDPNVPCERLAGIATDAAIALAILGPVDAGTFDACATVTMERLMQVSDAVPGFESNASGAAYVLYTSGSTGTPKGVEISHQAAANAILAACDVCSFDARDRTLYRTAISFDLSIYDIFCSLAMGGTLVVAPRTAIADPYALIELIVEHEITHLLLGPSLLAILLERRSFERCTSLRLVTCGGEALSLSLCERFFARTNAALYNLYGPSEATMLVTLHRCVEVDLQSSEVTAPLGRPLANTHVSVRDGGGWPVPPGAIGEIMIGGAQLAAGYINRADETARRFVRDVARPLEQLYRTGDLARLKLDGSIVFLGRSDKQIKICGSRVEPAEVAAAIERVDGIQTAVVCALRRAAAETSDAFVLVAYVKRRDGSKQTGGDVRTALQALLPSYMIPIDILFVETFPLTVSGKIDEKALAAGAFHQAIPPAESAPALTNEYSLRGIVREQVRMLWEKLLGRTGIGDYDNFFDIGGDSLLAVRLMMQLEETFGHRVALAEFFETMTIAALATLVAGDAVPEERDAVTFNESGTKTPFVYLHGDFAGGSYSWLLAALLGTDQPVTVVPPHGIPGRPPASDVLGMAADVVRTIERLHPDGPLRIGGYSAAGLVAYEAARQLATAGRIVLDVVLVGTNAEKSMFGILESVTTRLPIPKLLRQRLLRQVMSLALRFKRIALMSGPERREFLAVRSIGQRATHRLAPNELELGCEYGHYERAHAAYVPKHFDGNVTILWPAGEAEPGGRLESDWRRIAPRTHIVPVTGSHHGCVSRHLDEIADEIRHRFG
jgi:amino acid adenylation domain-containing protein